MGGGGHLPPPPIQQDSVALEKERISILNEQTKCSRSICSIFFKFLCTNSPFKSEKKVVRYRLGTVSIFPRGVGA